MKWTMNIGGRIKILRGANSQAVFSNLVGIPKNTLGRYERGEITPGGDAIALLCTKLNVDPNWLLFGEGSMYKNQSHGNDPGEEDAQPQAKTQPDQSACIDCRDLLAELAQERKTSRELVTENRELNKELRALVKENAELVIKLERARAPNNTGPTEAHLKAG